MIDGGGFGFSVGGTATEVTAGQHAIAVVGPGLESLDASSIGFIGGELTIEASSFISTSINCGGDNLPAVVFEVNVPAPAISGARSLFLRHGSDVAALTGALEVRGVNLPTPTPISTATATQPLATATRTPPNVCVGDCDGNGNVTVDEIVIMVNIALGNRPVTDCDNGDTDGSDTITVDEILTAIQNALNGC
jgi:hypothetical protein